jgi:ATP-binding cassette, subfamily B, bacterial
LQYHGQHRVGDLSTRVMGDVDRSQDMIVQLLAVLIPNALLLLGMVTVLFILDPGFALMALAITPILAIAVHRSTSQLKQAAKRARKADGLVASATTEHLGAVHLVQAYALERRQEQRFDTLNQASLTAGLESVRLQARFSPIVDVTGVLSTIVVLWIGSHRVLDRQLTVGEMLVFLSYVGSVYKPLKALAKLGQVMSKGGAATERVLDILGESPAITDQRGSIPAPRLRGAISFVDVSFSYGREPVLHNVNLQISPGETLALVGPTGAGKSTIAALICRLADPTNGTISLDGMDMRNFKVRSVREQISTVLQDCTLLHGSIRDNIALGNQRASSWQVDRAARLALVTEFTSRLPDGLDTIVGERGANLSGGQRQRIAIARAILRDAAILILDEPTSALDTASEQIIVEAVANLPSSRTTIVIAHRLSTIRRADRIAVVEGGRIVQLGSHHELLALDGLYRRLHAAPPLPPPTPGGAPRAIAPDRLIDWSMS